MGSHVKWQVMERVGGFTTAILKLENPSLLA
jgi:hypothetical protein